MTEIAGAGRERQKNDGMKERVKGVRRDGEQKREKKQMVREKEKEGKERERENNYGYLRRDWGRLACRADRRVREIERQRIKVGREEQRKFSRIK